MKYHLKLTAVILLIIVSCKKPNKDANANQLPAINKVAVNTITDSSVTINVNIASTGVSDITSKGVVVSTDTLPTLEKNLFKTSNGSGAANFIATVTGLTPSKKYFIRAYATNTFGTGYGNSVIFNTLSDSLPVISEVTHELAYIDDTSAYAVSRISDTGKASITAYGFVFGTDSLPTITNYFKKTDEAVPVTYLPFDYASQIHGLSFETKYYMRAYATNIAGTAYGICYSYQSSLSISSIPTVVTLGVTRTSEISAIAEGNLTSDGGHPIIYRGFVYSIFSMPTITSATFINSTADTGYYYSNLNSLDKTATYYVRAYATNMIGTSYGDQIVLQPSNNSNGFTLFKDQVIDTTLFTASVVGGGIATETVTMSYSNELQLPLGINLYIKFDSVYGNINTGGNNHFVQTGDTINFAPGAYITPFPDQFQEDSRCFYSIHIEGQALTSQTVYYCKYSIEHDRTISYDFIHIKADTINVCNFQH